MIRNSGLGVDGQLEGAVILQRHFKRSLLGRCEVWQERGNQVEADVFDLSAKLIVEVARLEDEVLREEGLFDAALIGAILRRANLTDMERLDG